MREAARGALKLAARELEAAGETEALAAAQNGIEALDDVSESEVGLVVASAQLLLLAALLTRRTK